MYIYIEGLHTSVPTICVLCLNQGITIPNTYKKDNIQL